MHAYKYAIHKIGFHTHTIHKRAYFLGVQGHPRDIEICAMLLLKTGIFAIYWNEILERNNATNKVQSSKMDINTEVASLRFLMRFVQSQTGVL